MKLIEWREEFSVGNDAIDDDHEHLIEQINQLYELLRQPMDVLSIEHMLNDIQTDISAHFALEELLMHEANYAEYQLHKDDHQKLLDQINDLAFSFGEDHETGKALLVRQLSDWFSQHFSSFDMRLHSQLDH